MTMHATCHTTGCGNAGLPIEVPPETAVICGVCSEPIIDLTETAPSLPEEMPTWLD